MFAVSKQVFIFMKDIINAQPKEILRVHMKRDEPPLCKKKLCLSYVFFKTPLKLFAKERRAENRCN